MKRNSKRGLSEDDATSASLESERGVLGSYFEPGVTVPDFPSEWLYRHSHRDIREAILAVKQRTGAPEIIAVSNQLNEWGKLADSGGISYLNELTSVRDGAIVSDLRVVEWLRIIEMHARRRFHYERLEQLGRVATEDFYCTVERWQAEEARRFPSASKEKPAPLPGKLMSEIDVEDFHWLWHARVALGKVAMFDGDGGVGKSLVSLDLVARVAMGRNMPDGSPGLGESAGAVIICGEDGLADTVKPRLLAAGVSPEAMRRIRVINEVPVSTKGGETSERLLSLLADRGEIERTLTEMGAKILVIDPLTAYLGDGVDPYKDTEVRRVLTPLARMAERTNCAIVPIRHLNRSHGAPAQHRGLGSVGITNLARLSLLFAPNPGAKGEYLFGRQKGNIGKPPPTMGYRITQVGAAENMPKVEWLGEKETSAEAGLAAQAGGERGESRTATVDAEEWLRDRLSAGPRPAKALIAEAVEDGIITDENHDKPLRTARERVCDKPYREGGIGGAGKWMWRLLLPSAGHLSENGSDGGATNPESNGDDAKMPSHEDGGHLSADKPTKMPSHEGTGHLSADPEFKGAHAPSESPISAKLPSSGESIGAGNLSADADEPSPAGVAGEPERTCARCGRHRFEDTFGDGIERCAVCATPLSGVDDVEQWAQPTPPPPNPDAPQRLGRWTSRQEVAAYD